MRRVTLDDVPWVRELFKHRFPAYDVDAAETWYRNHVLPNPIAWLAIRTDDAYLTAFLKRVPWDPAHADCEVVTVCADDGAVWQTGALLRASLDWAKERKADAWCYSSDTDYRIEPLVRRLGAYQQEPRFRIVL